MVSQKSIQENIYFFLPVSFKPLFASYNSGWIRELVLFSQLRLSCIAHDIRIMAFTLAFLRNFSLVEISLRVFDIKQIPLFGSLKIDLVAFPCLALSMLLSEEKGSKLWSRTLIGLYLSVRNVGFEGLKSISFS